MSKPIHPSTGAGRTSLSEQHCDITALLGAEADPLLSYTCKGIARDRLHLPGPDFIYRVVSDSGRNPATLRNLSTLFNSGRLSRTGYLSILPVDQGIEHSAGASFAPNPDMFDPENICKLAIEGGYNAVASTLGVMGSVARRYAHKIPFIMKFNHNEILSHPNPFILSFGFLLGLILIKLR